jgi:hypothetical protein
MMLTTQRIALIPAVMTLIAVLPVQAQTAGRSPSPSLSERILTCRTLTSESLRLNCYNGIDLDDAAADIQPGVTTKQTLATPPTEFRLVDPLDFSVAPRKFMGTGVEMRNMQCFYADKDDFRCFTTRSSEIVTVLTKTLQPDRQRAEIESDCGSVRAASNSSKCRRTIRFVPISAERERVGPLTERLTVMAGSISLVDPPPQPARRR